MNGQIAAKNSFSNLYFLDSASQLLVSTSTSLYIAIIY